MNDNILLFQPHTSCCHRYFFSLIDYKNYGYSGPTGCLQLFCSNLNSFQATLNQIIKIVSTLAGDADEIYIVVIRVLQILLPIVPLHDIS